MKLKPISIEKLSDFIIGDSGEVKNWPYKSGTQISLFFDGYGVLDTNRLISETSRVKGTRVKIQELNGQPALKKIVSQMLDKRYWDKAELDTHKICVMQLNELLNHDNFSVIKVGLGYEVRDLNHSMISIEDHFRIETLSEEQIEDHIQKCIYKISTQDYSGAITNARSLLEAVCVKIELDLSENPTGNNEGDLIKLFNKVRILLNLDPSNKTLNQSLQEVLTGLIKIVNGLASMRNQISDAHGGARFKADKHHAKLAVNSAKTVINFLLDSIDYQTKKGIMSKK